MNISIKFYSFLTSVLHKTLSTFSFLFSNSFFIISLTMTTVYYSMWDLNVGLIYNVLLSFCDLLLYFLNPKLIS